MERTDKVKIVLGVLLVLIFARLILGFFPEPLEFEPYATDAPAGKLQTVDAIEVQLCLTYVPEGSKPRYYYRFRTAEGEEGLFTDTVLYYDEVFPESATFTGITVALPDPDTIPTAQQEIFYAQLTLTEAELAKSGGDKAAAYRALSTVTALDLTFRDRTTPHPAAFWVGVAAMAAFCVMLAMLLKEYFGGRRRRAKDEEE